MSDKGKLYLIPNGLGADDLSMSIPQGVASAISSVRCVFVEHEKEARKLLISMGLKDHLDEIELISLKHGVPGEDKDFFLQKIKEGMDFGILSDAGCPAIADPGFEIVALAHQNNILVIPFVGPSSILLSLMASGFNGQNFCFHGYLPKEKQQRKNKIRAIEKDVWKRSQTQIFIETPFRNQYLFEDLLSSCQKNTKICIAKNLTLPDEWIRVKSVEDWKKTKIDLNKKPCIFLMYK